MRVHGSSSHGSRPHYYYYHRATRAPRSSPRDARARQVRRETRRHAAIFIGYARRYARRRRQAACGLERVQAQRLHEAGADE